MTALLEVRNLSRSFGGVQAVQDLSFDVGSGEILGLIGPNGAGKSTVFNLINGVVKPNSGTVTFEGVDITGMAPYLVARRGLARTFQIVQPLLGLTVFENCEVAACFGRENLALASARDVVLEVTELVGLNDRLNLPASALTTAGKKRLELARALCARPKLLLLDEVLAGLNPTEIGGMIATVRAIRAKGVSFLIIEHVIQAIMSLTYRILVVNLGRHLA